MGCSPSTPAANQKDNSQGGGASNKTEGDYHHQKSSKNQTEQKGLTIPLRNPSTGSSTHLFNSTPKFKMLEQRYSDKTEESSTRDGGNLIRMGPMSIFRDSPIRVGLSFPKEDSLFGGIQSACERLGWGNIVRVNTDQWTSLVQDPSTIDLLLIDYRQPKLLAQNILSIVRSMKDENSTLVVVAFVKKNSSEKCDSTACNLQMYGVDWVETENGLTTAAYWQQQLQQYERCLINPTIKISSAKALLVALDQCRDMIQITDSSHRIQFVNRAYEKLMGYSCEEISGCDFHELQTRGGGQLFGMDNDGLLTQQQQNLSRQDVSPTATLNTGGVSPNSGITSTQINTNPTAGSHPLAAPPFHDHLLADISHGKEWEGNYMYNPKTGDPIFLNSKVLPFNVNVPFNTTNYASSSSDTQNSSNKPKLGSTHYIYVSDIPSSYGEKSCSSDVTSNQDVGYPMPRGSLKSLRKASYDIKSISNDSSILRRQSLAKLHSLTIEAPITKVINIIAAAQQNCPLYIAQALEKVLEILRTTELYSPQFFEGGSKIKSDDPLTTDLLGALLSQGPRLTSSTGRRSSNENTASRLAPRPSLPDIAEAPTSLQKLLETEERWSFDVILLEEISERRPLVWLGMTIFNRFNVAQILSTDEATLRNWLTLIEANYHTANAYHNSTHAADVLQATAYFLSTERLKGFLDPLDEVISLIAAICHDVDHPGRTSAFLTNSANDLALLYNDLSVLESHHAAFTFKLTLSDPRVNIFQHLDQETFKVVRQSLIDMVLATEMTKHFEHLSKFVNVFTKPFLREDGQGGPSDHTPSTPTEPDISTLITPDNVVLIKRMLIKCADVGNPTRPLKQCIEWAKRIAEEYFRQTEEEIARGLPPVMPMFDRNTCSIPKSQTGFIDYFVADMYEAWDAFLDVPEVIDHMKYNYDYWKELDRQGSRAATLIESYVLTHPPPTTAQTSRLELSHL